MGYHFEKITRQQNTIRSFMQFLTAELDGFGAEAARGRRQADEVRSRREEALRRARERYESIPGEFRYDGDGVEHALASFRSAMTDPAGSAHAT